MFKKWIKTQVELAVIEYCKPYLDEILRLNDNINKNLKELETDTTSAENYINGWSEEQDMKAKEWRDRMEINSVKHQQAVETYLARMNEILEKKL